MAVSNRGQTLVNQAVNLGFRHFYSGVLQDAFQIIDVKILDPNFNPVLTVLGADVSHVGPGGYQVTVPANVLNRPGKWYDVWRIQSLSNSTVRALIFENDVVTILDSGPPNFPAVLQSRLADLDACMLKKYYLWPVWTTLQNGYYLSDAVLQHHIDVGITWAQRQLGIPLQQVRVLTFPYADDQTPFTPQIGVDYDEDGELLQWSAIGSLEWSSIRLPHSGIIRIRGLRGIYGGRTVYRIPNEWVDRNQLDMGFVRIRPTTAGAINNIVDNSGRFLDVTLLEGIGATHVPGFWAVDYDYGQPGGVFAKEITDVIMKKAALNLLEQLSASITKGLNSRSASVDGLSSSVSFSGGERGIFGALASQYAQDLSPENMIDMRRMYRGPSVFIL